MQAPPTLLLFAVALALLMPGCAEEPDTPPGVDLISEEDLPGTPITSAEDLKEVWDDLNEAADAKEIPEVNADTLTALRRQAMLQKKVLIVDCWATWCPSCVAMFPHLHKAIKERGEDVILMSLSFDEGEELTAKAGAFLTEQDAWDNAYRAVEGSDAKDALAKALSETWDGGALPAVFVYAPDGSVALEFTETRGEVQDWVEEITNAVDQSLSQ